MYMNRTNGRIAQVSRNKFAMALFELMKTYQYNEITVTQLAQEAALSRKTFYRLFNDKDEVLRQLFDILYEEFFSELTERGIQHYWDLVTLYFDFWERHKDQLVLLGQNNLLPKMFEYVYGNSEKIFIAVRTSEKASQFSKPLPYLLAYSVGGMHSMLIKWAESEMTIPSSKLIEQLKAGFQSPDL